MLAFRQRGKVNTFNNKIILARGSAIRRNTTSNIAHGLTSRTKRILCRGFSCPTTIIKCGNYILGGN